MHGRRLVKRSILGSRVYAPSPTGDGGPVTGVVQAVKQENRDALAAGPRRSVYTVLLQDGSLKEFTEEELAAGANHTAAKGPLKSSLKGSCWVTITFFIFFGTVYIGLRLRRTPYVLIDGTLERSVENLTGAS